MWSRPKLRDWDFVKASENETWKFVDYADIFLKIKKLKFFRITGIFLTCFGCFLSANFLSANFLSALVVSYLQAYGISMASAIVLSALAWPDLSPMPVYRTTTLFLWSTVSCSGLCAIRPLICPGIHAIRHPPVALLQPRGRSLCNVVLSPVASTRLWWIRGW